MAETIWIYYETATGAVTTTMSGDSGAPPRATEDGESVLDAGMQDPMPSQRTHKVDLAGPTLIAKPQSDFDAVRVAEIETAIADLDNRKAALEARNWSTTEVDNQITALEAERTALL